MSEVSLEGVRPPASFGAWSSRLSQNGKDSCRGLRQRARGKEPEAPNRMSVAFRNVLRPAVDEFFQRALHLNSPAQIFVLVPKDDCLLPGKRDATLSDWRSSDVTTSILQKMPFGFEGLNLDSPPSPLLLVEHLFYLISGHRSF
jgi:hypothetical protein